MLGPLLNRLGTPITLLSLLLAHAEAVRVANPRLGLVSPGDLAVLVPRHTADSLLFAFARRPLRGERWLDVGSGAGFPGLVLACCFPDCLFTLVEPLKRRAGFLRLAAADLGLGNVAIDERRLAEVAGADFDVSVARAFRSAAEATRMMLPAVRSGGLALVAIGAGAAAAPGAEIIKVEHFDNVDSPGLFSMMTRTG